MIAVALMVVFTICAVFFLIESGKCSRMAAEIVLSRAWTSRFARQTLEEKRDAFAEAYKKYQSVSEKKAKKTLKEWQKQIDAYKKAEETYLSGKIFSVLDMVPLFGYQLMTELKINADSDLLRKLAGSCEHTGYIELERGQETGGKRNSYIYAWYLLASLFSFLYVGVMLCCFVGTLVLAVGNSGLMGVAMPMAVGLVGPALYGYIPYDNLRGRAQ